MPVYNFICPICGTRFEERLSYDADTHHILCPRGHAGARRVFSAPAVVFKGSGFYVTDHRKQAGKEGSAD